ncbi:MAG: AMP-binding protein [Alicyclobacillaceae bacterium]|nr:AMP-binding protein [Alicyclobacillaceae bacterium]
MERLAEQQTIADIVESAANRFGDRTAVVDGATRLSFRDVRHLARRLAKQLVRMGIRPGDCVGVQLPNNWHYVVTHLALTYAGAVLTPLNMAYRRKELEYMLRHNEAKMLVVSSSYRGFDHAGLAREVAGAVPSLKHLVISGGGAANGEVSLEELLAADPDGVSDADLDALRPKMSDTFAIMFTSGTESDPKATRHTYATFVPVHVLQSYEYQFSSDDVLVCLGSFSHMFSIPMILEALHHGIRQVLMETYSPAAFLNLAEQERITVALGVPSMWLDILHTAGQVGKRPRLRLVVTGGSKIPPHMVHQLREQFGCTVAAQWGMTEVCAASYTRPDDPAEKSWETIGRACPGGELKILNEQLEPAPVGEVGQLAFRGPSVFVEYYKNPAATAKSFTEDGFFLTGDLAWLDEQGYAHFVGRIKDTINRGGMKIYAAEIEDLLLQHPVIRQAAVVRMPDPRLGERACAFVSIDPGATLTLDDVRVFLLDKGLAKFKLPERLEIRDALPATPSGKVQKAALVAEAAALVEREQAELGGSGQA